MERLAEIARYKVDPVLFTALLLVSLLSIFDYYLTLLILGLGGAEANPVFCHLLPTRPEVSYWLKFALTSSGVTVLAAMSHLKLARAAVFTMLSVYGVLILYEIALICLLTS